MYKVSASIPRGTPISNFVSQRFAPGSPLSVQPSRLLVSAFVEEQQNVSAFLPGNVTYIYLT